MAQRLLQNTLEQAGMGTVTTTSAGVFAVEGMSATQETQRVLQSVGVDSSDHRARLVAPEMIEQADTIFVMEQFHMDELVRRYPNVKDKIHLLKSYGLPEGYEEPNPNIPDPIGKPLEVYEVCFSIIQDAVARLAKTLGVQRS